MKPISFLFVALSTIFAVNSKLNAQIFEVDTSFHIGFGFDGLVRAIDIQNDGKIIAVGDFNSYDGHPSPRIVRINTNGSFDNTFSSPIVLSGVPQFLGNIKIQPNGQILISGKGIYPIDSTLLLPGTVFYATFSRLNSNGSFDFTFSQNAFNSTYGAIGILPGGVTSENFILQNDGSILFGMDDIGIVKLLNNGTSVITTCNVPQIFTRFSPPTLLSLPFSKMLVNDNLDILFFGRFDTLSSTCYACDHRHNQVAFTSGLCLKTSTHALDTAVYTTLRLGANQFLVGGSFSNYDGNVAYQIAKIDNNGAFNTSFALSSHLNCTAVICLEQAENRILLGAVNGYYSGMPLNNISVFNLDGTIDSISSVSLTPNAIVTAIKANTTGVVYAAGDFLSFNGLSYPRICKLMKKSILPGGVGIDAQKRELIIEHSFESVNITYPYSDIKELAVYDMGGRLIAKMKNIPKNRKTNIELKHGFYIFKIIASDENVIMRKIGH